jgi:hypothetical protein
MLHRFLGNGHVNFNRNMKQYDLSETSDCLRDNGVTTHKTALLLSNMRYEKVKKSKNMVYRHSDSTVIMQRIISAPMSTV